MRNILIGIGITLLFVGGIGAAWEAWSLEQARAHANVAYIWLSEPVLEVEGKKYSRAQVLDLLLVKALKVQNGNAEDPKK